MASNKLIKNSLGYRQLRRAVKRQPDKDRISIDDCILQYICYLDEKASIQEEQLKILNRLTDNLSDQIGVQQKMIDILTKAVYGGNPDGQSEDPDGIVEGDNDGIPPAAEDRA